MGKQRSKQKSITKPLPSANAINWEGRVRELVRAGILSPLTLDNGGYGNPRPIEDKRTAGQIERARRDVVQKAKTEAQQDLTATSHNKEN